MKADGPRGRGLALVGLRGTGKSTVGRLVAARAGRDFLDADAALEARAGRTIPRLFAGEGEAAFRDLEEQVLAELVQTNPGAVLATGGGVVLRPSNRARLRVFGTVIWLTAEPELLAARLAADPIGLAGRPALTPAGTLAELADLLRARAPLYRDVAHAIVAADGRTADEVADAVLLAWEPF